jgi:hypothetical protein
MNLNDMPFTEADLDRVQDLTNAFHYAQQDIAKGSDDIVYQLTGQQL